MKQVDTNGFWSIKNNPISKVGVFPYLGRQIDPSLEPDKVYMVLRPAEELFNEETLESFNTNPVPLVDDHTMIGEDYTPAEKKGVDGVVNNIHQEGDALVGDISIYSEAMKDKISKGKKDLSMGYFCTYDLEEGDYNGQHYDAIQRNIRSNHVALVDRGRCGHDVRVFDTWCFDCAIADENLNTNKEQNMEATDADFEESKHPRANNGQFTSGGGGVGAAPKSNNRKQNNINAYLDKKNKLFRSLSHAESLVVANEKAKTLHNKAQELSKMHLGQVTGHIRKGDSGEIFVKKGDKHYKLSYKIVNAPGNSGFRLHFGDIKSVQDTASDSGVKASTCDADFQSKIEEIRTMIDKEKLSALKELVAMLESDSPAGDAKPCDELPDEEKENLFEEKKEDEEVVKDEAVDKRELIREIGAIAGKGGLSEEDVRTLMQKAEQLAYSDSERSADDEEEEIIEEKIEKQPEEKKESEDALPKKIFEMLADRDALVNKVKPLIGNFDFSKMTSEQVAKYACDKLDIKSDTPRAALDGYLKGYSKSKMYSIDSAAQHIETTNSQLEKYLKGE
ncbi:MAG: DUF2213 domain-containing protein [Bacteroidales bacterium]|nr:DUF2213 domain-containing protein [Bacteroidales bacterium]